MKEALHDPDYGVAAVLAVAEAERPQLGPDELALRTEVAAPMGLPVSGEAANDHPGPSVAERVAGGTSALGLGVFIERGAGFVANILAARFGGTSTFGAYSLAISTANQISTYAAGGIGSTAVRFSGKYSYSSPSYSNLARALAIVSLFSAALAATALWLGAGPIALLLGKQELSGLLRWAALSAAGIILLECARGFFVGQRRLVALVLLSVLVGAGMLILLPIAARAHDPIRMVVLQGGITTVAVVVCLLFSRSLHLHARPVTSTRPATTMSAILREVWAFGLVQLAGLVGSNLAGWWLMTLVARADTSLVQMSFFAIASQLRNLVGIVPGLVTEGSYAVMADPELDAVTPHELGSSNARIDRDGARIPHRVMALCSFASLTVSLFLASIGIVFGPWLLTLLYGSSYAPAGLTVALGLAIAVVHMGNAPAAARLTIVSLRATGVINTVWALFVAAAASLFLFFHGSAWHAMLIYFIAHLFSAALVLAILKRKDYLPRGMVHLFTVGCGATIALVLLAYFRFTHASAQGSVTLAMFALFLASLFTLISLGKRFRWLPAPTAISTLFARLTGSRLRRPRHV